MELAADKVVHGLIQVVVSITGQFGESVLSDGNDDAFSGEVAGLIGTGRVRDANDSEWWTELPKV